MRCICMEVGPVWQIRVGAASVRKAAKHSGGSEEALDGGGAAHSASKLAAARCTHHTCDVAGGLSQVDWAEGRAPPEAVQLLGEPKGHPQVLQPLCGTVRQVDQQRWQPRPRLQLLCQESATCGSGGGGEPGPRY